MHAVTSWLAAMPTLIGFGLALGLNPALYGATADTLARNQNVRARLTWLLTGLAVGATVLVLVLHGLNPADLMSTVQQRGDAVVENRIVDLVVGTLMLVGAAAMALWVGLVPEVPRKPARESDENSAPASLFLLGFSSAIVGFTTLPIMYLTGRLVASLSSDLVLRLVAYAVFLAALVGPFVVLAWLWSRFPAATQKVTDLYGKVLAWDSRRVACVVMAFGGLSLLGFAVFWHR